MREVWFDGFGNFSERDCKEIAKVMNGQSYMNFHVIYSNCFGNCQLGVETEYDGTDEEIRSMFMNCLIYRTAELSRIANV